MEYQTRLQQFIDVVRRANEIATTDQLETLWEQMLDLIRAVTGAGAGALYEYDEPGDALTLAKTQGLDPADGTPAARVRIQQNGLGGLFAKQRPFFVADAAVDPLVDASVCLLPKTKMRTLYSLPLLLMQRPVGLLLLYNVSESAISDAEDVALVQLLGERLSSEMIRLQMLEQVQSRERRQQALVDVIANITTTLERDQLLEQIMGHATRLLEVEATSIWLRDEVRHELVLQTATGRHSDRMRELRVPAGKGIIGYVTRTGERVLVSNARDDARFYKQVDQESGFVTRSILCVPLRARKIQLGGEQGEIEETIIGGAQALNKRNGQPFTDEDISLFEVLASQAATVLQLSRLYERNSRLFLGVIHAVTGAIDLKDPYTRGHSQRVSEFSVAIAKELGLPRELIYHIRIGGMLHDVGKIGVHDTILQKPDHLTDAEMAEMKQHPLKGVRLLEEADLAELLYLELEALAQHHERLDGRGYPQGLRGAQITQIGRIVAVADAFDAMTSTRPYRPGMPVAKALAILRRAAGTEYDSACVEALVQARQRGLIQVQAERDG